MWRPQRVASSHNVTLACLFLSSSSPAAPSRHLDTRQTRCHAPRAFRSLSWSCAHVYFPFYIISSTFECVTAAETGFRLFRIQQHVPKQPVLYLAWDIKTKYIMIQTSCPCTLMNESLSLSLLGNIICPNFKTRHSLLHWFNSFQFKFVSDWNTRMNNRSQNNTKLSSSVINSL